MFNKDSNSISTEYYLFLLLIQFISSQLHITTLRDDQDMVIRYLNSRLRIRKYDLFNKDTEKLCCGLIQIHTRGFNLINSPTGFRDQVMQLIQRADRRVAYLLQRHSVYFQVDTSRNGMGQVIWSECKIVNFRQLEFLAYASRIFMKAIRLIKCSLI